MQQREKLLLAVLLGALGFWVLLPLLERILLGPFQSRIDQRDALIDRVATKQKDRDELEEIQRQLMFWTIDSLPPEPLNAQRVYSEWLVDLARLSGLRNIEPTLPNRTTVAGVYVAIPVSLKAEGTLKDVAAFLYHFDRAKVLQRVTKCDVQSPDTEGDPQLAVTIAAEGLSLPEARQRARLFPRSNLKAALSADAAQLVVESAAAFPAEGPLRLRIEDEFLEVTQRDGTSWTVRRGVDSTVAADHPAGAVVEMAPVKPADPSQPQSIADYERLLTAGPFVKPRPPFVYRPQLASIPNATLIRGNTFSAQAKVSSWDPADGPPQYELDEFSPASMQIDDEGRITWTPGPTADPDVYPVGVIVTSKSNRSRTLQTAFTVTLQLPNLPPQVTPPATVPIAWIGRVWSVSVTAVDQDQSGRLQYSLTGQIPTGLTIDERTGVLRWDVGQATEPGTFPITVQVSDGGNPPQTATASLTIQVEDDAAQFTYLVGCIRDGENWTAWLYDRSSNKSQYLKVGQQFAVSDIAGKVTSINLTSMEFADGEGLWKLVQEQPLRKAELIGAPQPAASPDAAPQPAGSPASASPPEPKPTDATPIPSELPAPAGDTPAVPGAESEAEEPLPKQ